MPYAFLIKRRAVKKMRFYASNTEFDKAGSNIDIIIGGSHENSEEENNGPEIHPYLHDLTFTEGRNSNEFPLWIALMEDDSGISTSSKAVDHDMVVILDNDQSNPVVLCD